jgi:hypothetical protein
MWNTWFLLLDITSSGRLGYLMAPLTRRTLESQETAPNRRTRHGPPGGDPIAYPALETPLLQSIELERSLGSDLDDTHHYWEGFDARPEGREPEFCGEGRLRSSPPSNLHDHRHLALPVRAHDPDVEGDPE